MTGLFSAFLHGELKNNYRYLQNPYCAVGKTHKTIIFSESENNHCSYSPTHRFDVLKAFRLGRQHVTQALALEPAPIASVGRPGKGAEENVYYNKQYSEAKGGADPEYLTARIARDRPDILEKMQQGQYPSARAAAIDAGIVKPRIQLTLGPSTTPQNFAGALRHALAETLATLAAISLSLEA